MNDYAEIAVFGGIILGIYNLALMQRTRWFLIGSIGAGAGFGIAAISFASLT